MLLQLSFGNNRTSWLLPFYWRPPHGNPHLKNLHTERLAHQKTYNLQALGLLSDFVLQTAQLNLSQTLALMLLAFAAIHQMQYLRCLNAIDEN